MCNLNQRTYDYDVAIIGGGSAGYSAARTSAEAGLRTVMIDGGAEIGGLCILRGCMPTKSLLYAAEAMHFAGKLQTWGILAGNVSFDFGQVMTRKNAFIEDLATSRRDDLTDGKFKFLRGRARFSDPHTVEFEGHPPITSANFVITTGSSVAPPPLPGFNEAGYPFSELGKSVIMDATDGHVKLLADPESGEILGGACVGPLGGELIHEIVTAMAKRMSVHELGALPHYHPTLAEIWTYPADELAGRIIP